MEGIQKLPLAVRALDLRSTAFSKYMNSLRVKSGDRWFYYDKVNNQFHPCDEMSWIQLEGHWATLRSLVPRPAPSLSFSAATR